MPRVTAPELVPENCEVAPSMPSAKSPGLSPAGDPRGLDACRQGRTRSGNTDQRDKSHQISVRRNLLASTPSQKGSRGVLPKTGRLGRRHFGPSETKIASMPLVWLKANVAAIDDMTSRDRRGRLRCARDPSVVANHEKELVQ